MNKRRKADKAKEIANYHYYKWNYQKALKSYLRMWKYDEWYGKRDTYLYNMAYSYKCLWDYTKALKVIEYLKTCWTYTYETLELKKEVLEYVWNMKEAQICQNKMDEINDAISDDTLLEEYLKHTA